MNASRTRRWPILAALAFVIVAHPVRAAEIDPEADKVLRSMSDHLAGIKAFSVATDTSTEVILQDGRKIQLVASGSGLFDRERGFRFQREGVRGGIELAFNGREMTLYSGALNGYHTIALKGGNDAALDEVRAAFGIEAAGGADLLYTNPYEGLLYEVQRGDYLGEVRLDGVRTHHLSYRAAEVDWQIWIKADGEPLPLKYVVTSKFVTGAPQYSVQVREWNTAASIDAADIAFTPPDGARELGAEDFLALDIALPE